MKGEQFIGLFVYRLPQARRMGLFVLFLVLFILFSLFIYDFTAATFSFFLPEAFLSFVAASAFIL